MTLKPALAKSLSFFISDLGGFIRSPLEPKFSSVDFQSSSIEIHSVKNLTVFCSWIYNSGFNSRLTDYKAGQLIVSWLVPVRTIKVFGKEIFEKSLEGC